MTISRLSVLDQSPIPAGSTPQQALRCTRELALRVEALGYHRYWLAGHHGSKSFAGSAPSHAVCRSSADSADEKA